MRIAAVEITAFAYPSRIAVDEEGHSHPGPEHDRVQTLTRVVADNGCVGYALGGSEAMLEAARPVLVGRDPLDREWIWDRLRQNQRAFKTALSDANIGVLDLALWDLAGQAAQLPVYKLLGGFRDRVPAYASTMCGDDLTGGLDSPEAYAEFAVRCQQRGYTGFKLHTWMYPLGPDPRRDVAACRAVRERVGPDMRLMLDCHHSYSRGEARWIGRELEKLDFHWFEEPLNEDSTSSYAWLADQLDIAVIGPEQAAGKMYTRAEWIVRGACDISRYDVWHAGITAAMKTVHLCESFGIGLEIHGGGAGNLHVLGAMSIPGEFYEQGLLHPQLSVEEGGTVWGAWGPWLKQPLDTLDADGYVHLPQSPGLGQDWDWDFIQAHTVRPWS